MNATHLDSKSVIQVCFVTENLEQTAAWFSGFLNLPIPQFITSAGLPEAATEYLGQPSEARCRMVFFKLANLDIELIEPDKYPSCWRDFLDRNGPGVHHLAFRVDGMATKVRNFESQGLKLLQKGEFSGGRYAYLDTEKHIGLLAELLEFDNMAN